MLENGTMEFHQLDFKILRCLDALVSDAHFMRAAEQLNMSQPQSTDRRGFNIVVQDSLVHLASLRSLERSAGGAGYRLFPAFPDVQRNHLDVVEG